MDEFILGMLLLQFCFHFIFVLIVLLEFIGVYGLRKFVNIADNGLIGYIVKLS